jgi:hypothetical protein
MLKEQKEHNEQEVNNSPLLLRRAGAGKRQGRNILSGIAVIFPWINCSTCLEAGVNAGHAAVRERMSVKVAVR